MKTWRNYIKILHLFSFQSKLNEYLLKLFIHKINAELFKAIFVKNFKPINIKNAYIISSTIGKHSSIYSLD